METEFDSTVDYYRVLGIKSNATQDEIKQSHIQLALKYHPDVNKEINIEKYRDIQNAYNILSRPEIRESYDLTRRRMIHRNDFYPDKNSNFRDLNKNIDIPNYDVQRLQFKETQKHASSNWRELKDKYKSEQWQKKDLAFKKVGFYIWFK